MLGQALQFAFLREACFLALLLVSQDFLMKSGGIRRRPHEPSYVLAPHNKVFALRRKDAAGTICNGATRDCWPEENVDREAATKTVTQGEFHIGEKKGEN